MSGMGECPAERNYLLYISQHIFFLEMVEGEPKLFKNWDPYMKMRQVAASAVIFKHHGWLRWQMGHARLFGVLLWNYESRQSRRFKYSKILKKQGYKRTHNYRLLKDILENKILQKEGNGYYSFTAQESTTIRQVITVMKELDMISGRMPIRVKRKSKDIVS
jgi:hypothetical protein